MKPKIEPIITSDTSVFWEGTRVGEIKLQKCSECGLTRWPASIICPSCYSTDFNVISASGRGKLYSYVVFHKAFSPALEGETPYIVATVDLEEGPRILVGIDLKYLASLKQDAELQAVWNESSSGNELQAPEFIPVQPGS